MIKSILQNVFARIAIYATSALPGLLAAWGLGWIKITFDGVDWLTIKFSLVGLSTMLASMVGVSGGIFAKFGTK